MVSGTTYDQRIVETWAGHFSSSPEDAHTPGTTVISRPHLLGSGAVHIAHIAARAYAEVDPQLAEELTSLSARVGATAALTAAAITSLVQPNRVVSVDSGLIFHLHPGRAVPISPPSPVQLRVLGPPDAPELEQLAHLCTPREVDDAFVAANHEILYGCFDLGHLLAAGSGYRRNGFMDIGVLTTPKHRGKHLAKAIASAIARDAIIKNVIPQYRCDVTNPASRKVAEGAGFTLHFRTDSVRLLLPGNVAA